MLSSSSRGCWKKNPRATCSSCPHSQFCSYQEEKYLLSFDPRGCQKNYYSNSTLCGLFSFCTLASPMVTPSNNEVCNFFKFIFVAEEWGTYRPNLYFGTRATHPDSPVFGIMWSLELQFRSSRWFGIVDFVI